MQARMPAANVVDEREEKLRKGKRGEDMGRIIIRPPIFAEIYVK